MYNIELKNELERRWSSVREELARQQADALLVTTNVNLYYVSGRVFAGMAYIPNEGEPLFFVRRPVGLKGENVLYIRKPEEIGDCLRERGISLPRKLLLETDSIPMSEYLRYDKIFSPEQTGNGTRLLRTVRSVKTPFELGRLRLSGRLHAEVYRRIPELFRPGMTDLELSVEIERESRLKGSRGIFRIFGQSMEIFGGSVLAGDNADTPSPYDFALGGGGLDTSLPVGANGTVLSDGMSVMVDMGGNFTGYMTDMTRVFSVGKLPDLAYRAHDTSLEIQRRIAAAKSVVMDGRDIGTNVLPGASHKFYVTASLETRARRRLRELQSKGEDTTYEKVFADLKARDHNDMTRALNPLVQAEDAVFISTDEYGIEETTRKILSYIRS